MLICQASNKFGHAFLLTRSRMLRYFLRGLETAGLQQTELSSFPKPSDCLSLSLCASLSLSLSSQRTSLLLSFVFIWKSPPSSRESLRPTSPAPKPAQPNHDVSRSSRVAARKAVARFCPHELPSSGHSPGDKAAGKPPCPNRSTGGI